MNALSRLWVTTVTFLREVRVELTKTSFPSRQVTTKNTVIVIAFSIVMALFLGLLDILFSYLLNTYIIGA
ncbi:MAG: preprotein translocase subunit SecE [Patescibacteria group bacterium]